MNLYLHTSKFDTVVELWGPVVLGTPLFSLRFRDQPELHSLLRTNSTGGEYGLFWDRCLPTPFGFGLAADWLEDHSDAVAEACSIDYPKRQGFSGDKKVALSLLVYEFRRRFSGAERP